MSLQRAVLQEEEEELRSLKGVTLQKRVYFGEMLQCHCEDF